MTLVFGHTLLFVLLCGGGGVADVVAFVALWYLYVSNCCWVIVFISQRYPFGSSSATAQLQQFIFAMKLAYRTVAAHIRQQIIGVIILVYTYECVCLVYKKLVTSCLCWMVKAFWWRLSTLGQLASQSLSVWWGGRHCCTYEIYVAAHPAAVGRSLCSMLLYHADRMCFLLSASRLCEICANFIMWTLCLCVQRASDHLPVYYVCGCVHIHVRMKVMCVSGSRLHILFKLLAIVLSTCLCCGFGFEYFSHLFVVFCLYFLWF